MKRPEDFLALVQQGRQGRIKVYIGSSAGVGKTYRMLQETRQLLDRGVDVVLGFVETHGRPETQALLAGLPMIPPRKVNYRDLLVEELDLEAVLARRPEVVVVDELPHTNPPGFRNRWRYQDVETLSAAGIHVICAMNVQHLTSLGELVERATGVRVRETVPDAFLRRADQVVNLDLSAEDLIERLKAGKVYRPDRIEAALASFFKRENLEILRELALREVAESLDRRQANRGEGAGKVMVCVSSGSPAPLRLVERGSRYAGRLNTHWYVVHVRTDQPVESEEQRYFLDALATAQRLGAEVVQLEGEPVQAILDFARAHGVEHLVVGRSLRSRWQEIWQEGPLMRLLRSAENLDIQVVPMDPRKSS